MQDVVKQVLRRAVGLSLILWVCIGFKKLWGKRIVLSKNDILMVRYDAAMTPFILRFLGGKEQWDSLLAAL